MYSVLLSKTNKIKYIHTCLKYLVIYLDNKNDSNSTNTIQHKALAGENFCGIGAARKLVEKPLAVEVSSIVELQDLTIYLPDKTLADC